MSELVGDLQADKKYYQTNIALAAELAVLFALAWRFEPTMVVVLLVLMLILLATIPTRSSPTTSTTPRPSSQTRR
jgi:hypothetical protein